MSRTGQEKKMYDQLRAVISCIQYKDKQVIMEVLRLHGVDWMNSKVLRLFSIGRECNISIDRECNCQSSLSPNKLTGNITDASQIQELAYDRLCDHEKNVMWRTLTLHILLTAPDIYPMMHFDVVKFLSNLLAGNVSLTLSSLSTSMFSF